MHAPFYVYAYAFGNLLVEALMERAGADPDGFAPLYEDAARGRRREDLCRGAGAVRPRPPRQGLLGRGCARLERLVDEFEALV